MMNIARLNQMGSGRERRGGFDPNMWSDLGDDMKDKARELGMPIYDPWLSALPYDYKSGSNKRSMWEETAWGMGMGNVGSEKELQRLFDAYEGTSPKDFDSYGDVQGMIDWDKENQEKLKEEENPTEEADPTDHTAASNPDRPEAAPGDELDTGEDQWGNMMQMMMMMNSMKQEEMPKPEAPKMAITGSSGASSNAQGARAKRSASFKSGLSTTGTRGLNRSNMRIGSLNMA